MTVAKRYPLRQKNTVNYQDLIINNSDNQPVWKRLTSFLLTLVCWGFWFYLWTPLPDLVQKLRATGFSEISLVPASYTLIFLVLLLSLSSCNIVWLNYNRVRFKGKSRRRKKDLLGNHEMGQFFVVDNNNLEYWQQSKCLVIRHDETGDIQKIDINEFYSFAPSIPDGKQGKSAFQRHYIVIMRRSSVSILFKKIGKDFVTIIKVLCKILNLKFVSCTVETKHLSIIIDIPSSYNAEKVVIELKKASSQIIQKQYNRDLVNKTAELHFWASRHLRMNEKITGRNMKQFIQEKDVSSVGSMD